jgi:hypothetical protein
MKKKIILYSVKVLKKIILTVQNIKVVNYFFHFGGDLKYNITISKHLMHGQCHCNSSTRTKSK